MLVTVALWQLYYYVWLNRESLPRSNAGMSARARHVRCCLIAERALDIKRLQVAVLPGNKPSGSFARIRANEQCVVAAKVRPVVFALPTAPA